MVRAGAVVGLAPVVLPVRVLVARPAVLLGPRLLPAGVADARPIGGEAGEVDAAAPLFGERPKCLGVARLQVILEGVRRRPRVLRFRPLAAKGQPVAAGLGIDVGLGRPEGRPPARLQERRRPGIGIGLACLGVV